MKTYDELNAKQQRFVDEYLVDSNATRACIKAGYSKKNADKIGPALLGNNRVAEAIDEKRRRLEIKTEITVEKVLQEYAKLGFSNIQDFVDWNNGAIVIKPASTLTREQTACISEITETTTKDGTTVKVKLYDKKSALDSIAKHLGMFIDKHEVTGKDGKPLQSNQPVINLEKLSKLNAEQLAAFEAIITILGTDTSGESEAQS